jgi:hypothetical protein
VLAKTEGLISSRSSYSLISGRRQTNSSSCSHAADDTLDWESQKLSQARPITHFWSVQTRDRTPILSMAYAA